MSTSEASSSKHPITPQNTLLSALHQLTVQEVFHNTTPIEAHNFHPFTANDKDAPLDQLVDLQNSTTAIIESLRDYATMQVTDSKFVSILKQYSTIAQNIHFSERETRRRAEAFRERPATTVYSEPIPLDRSATVDWAISRFEEWAGNVGMERFKDESAEGHVTLMFGGKMLALEVNLDVKRSPLEQARIRVASVKTSHALPSSGSTTHAIAVGSGGLDDLIKSTWNHYLDEIQLDAVESSMKAAQLRMDIQRQMQYLLKLDALAVSEGDAGLRWFNDVGNMNEIAQRLVNAEAEVVARALSAPSAPLDIFLNRGHALPMPYLVAPFMSFLVYTSPLAYYSILRSWQASQPFTDTLPKHQFEKLDIPSNFLRRYLLKKTSRPSGAIIATLSLEQYPLGYRPRPDPYSLYLRPNYQLLPNMSLNWADHIFLEPHIQMNPSTPAAPTQKTTWVLDFTDNGSRAGIVVSQARMREIQLVIDPDTSTDDFGIPIAGTGKSWVELLLNPSNPSAVIGRYVAVYKSPLESHPPLRLRLTPPDEAGFILGKVPVRTLKEVWGILEVVRDQCWLNETLRSCEWVPETEEDPHDGGVKGTVNTFESDKGKGKDIFSAENDEATEEELNAILSGTYPTRLIPVSVELPYTVSPLSAVPSLFPDPDGTDPFSIGRANSVPRISLSVHTPRTAGTSLGGALVNIHVTHDPSRIKGVKVEVVGTLPMTVEQVEELEESVRRGGVLGIAGRVWKWEGI